MFLAQRTAGPERTSFGLGAAERGLSAGMGKSGREEAGEAGRGQRAGPWGPQSELHPHKEGKLWRPSVEASESV